MNLLSQQSRYLAIAETLREQIRDGRIPVGARLPTEKSLQDAFGGVSRFTVRRATALLEEEGLVERLGERGLRVAAPRPEPVARRASGIEVQVFFDLGAGSRKDILQTGVVQSILEAVGHVSLSALPPGGRFADFARHSPGMVGPKIVFASGYEPSADDEAELARLGSAAVVIGRAKPGCSIPQVNGNHRLGGYILTRHLVERGHRAIALMTGPSGHVAEDWITEGYRRALAEAGIAPDARRILHADGPLAPRGAAMATELLRQRESGEITATALVTIGNWLTRGAMDEFRRQRLRVPEDLAVAMYFHRPDTDEVCGLPMTGVEEDTGVLVETALKTLDTLARGEPAERESLAANVALVVRRSCGGF